VISQIEQQPNKPNDQAFLSATMGSTCAARRAGINDASSAAKLMMMTAKDSMIGSHGLTPNN
jgi:hypothetical protein